MICLGNICRSPLAEGIMQHLCAKQRLGWEIDSAGTGDWHVGNPPDKRSVSIARQRGVDISQQKCRLFRVSDFADFDHIYVMDRSNLKNILTMAPNEESAQKVQLLLKDREVPDPYYNDDQFETVFDMVEEGCKFIIKELT